MNIDMISEILAAEEDSDAVLKNIVLNVQHQGLSREEIQFILSHQKNTLSSLLLSALAYGYLNDYQNAIQLLDRAIIQGDTTGMTLRALMYSMGQVTNQPDYAQAIILLDRAILQGDTSAMSLRAYMYIAGHGTPTNQPDYAQAIILLDRAILQGDTTTAIYVRASMYRAGQGTPTNQPDYAQAIILLDRAILQGDTSAMYMRADMYRAGQGTPNNQPDYAQAIILLDRAILQGDTRAMYMRADMYRAGHGTPTNQPDYAQAIILLDRAILQGDTTAMYVRADMYSAGRGTPTNQPDYAQAIILLDRAILQGDTRAMYVRASMYIAGHGTPTNQPDYTQAIILLDRAILGGNIRAMLLRVDMYLSRLGADDKAAKSNALELIIKICCTDFTSISNKTHIKKALEKMIKNGHLESEYFLFINSYKPDGFFSDKTAALALFKTHPIELFITFCQACINAVKTLELTDEGAQMQIEHINELRALIPKCKETPIVQATINRYMAYHALFILEKPTISYDYFRNVPEHYLSADDLLDISNQLFCEENINFSVSNTAIALELAQYAKEKAPNDKAVIGLNRVLTKLYLKKNIFTEPRDEQISAYEALQLHAKAVRINRATRQIELLKNYQNYLMVKDELEPKSQQSFNFFNMRAPIPDTKATVVKLLHALDMGNTLENLLDMPYIIEARMDESFDKLMNKLIELPFLPAQNSLFIC